MVARYIRASHPDRLCFEADIGMVRGIAGMCGVILVVLSSGSGDCCWTGLRGGSSLLHIFCLRGWISCLIVSGLFDELKNVYTYVM